MRGVLFLLAGLLWSADLGAGYQWLLVGQHFHTTTSVAFSKNPQSGDLSSSYDPKGLGKLIDRAFEAKLDAMIVTEHNTVAHCFDEKFFAKKLNIICGEEWTTTRSLHLGILNPIIKNPNDAVYPNQPGRSLPKEKVELEARNTIISIRKARALAKSATLTVINHPGYSIYQPSTGLGADAVEAVVPSYEHAASARLWWLRRLQAGERLVALGGSDYHYCEGLDCIRHGDIFRSLFNEPVNLVLGGSASQTDILTAMKRGRVVALSSSKYRDLRVDFRAHYNGKDYILGQHIPSVGNNERVSFSLRIANAKGLVASVYRLGKSQTEPSIRVFEAEIEKDLWSAEWFVTKRSSREAVHVELYKKDHETPDAIVNPIYF